MNDPGLPEEEHIVSGGTARWWHFVIVVVAAVGLVLAAWWWFAGRGPATEGPPTGGTVTEVPEGSRTVTLFFADEEDPVLVSETRQVAIGMSMVEQARQVLRALADGPEHNGVSAIPEGTEILDVYYNTDARRLYVDFGGELVANHPGGAAAEYSTVQAIMRTVSENFPEVQSVQFLVEGYQVGTIAGHINAYKPFHVEDWR